MANDVYDDEEDVAEDLSAMLDLLSPVELVQILSDTMAEKSEEAESATKKEELGRASTTLADVVLDLGDQT